MNKIGRINGAPSKRRMNFIWSVTSTALPTSSAEIVASMKPEKAMPCSCRIICSVHRIKLKPQKKNITARSVWRT